MSVLSLDAAALATLFPFHFRLDASLRFIAVSPVLARLMPDLGPGADLLTHFQIERPVLRPSFATLADCHRVMFLLRACRRPGQPELLLRGQMMAFPDTRELLFVGNPRLRELADMKQLGLTMRDFSVDSTLTDYLILIRTQQTALAEAQRLATDLAQARDVAQMASNSKSEFLANMSHELRTPLNAVLGFSELLKFQYTKMSGEDAAKYVDMIHEGGRKLLSTINIILDFSRMEAAEMPSEEVAFNVTDAIMACVAQMRRRVEAIGVEISTEVEDDYCLIGDEKSIHHALVNILENASQFTPAGSRIETSVNANDLGEIAISVSDSGPGIEPRVLASVGKSFIRGGSVNTQQYGGLGLGLKIAQRLINLHGGRLEIENRSTGGACVRLVFPASRNLTQTGSTKASESLRG